MLNVYNNLKTVLNQCNYTKKSIVNSNYDNFILENIKFMKTLIKDSEFIDCIFNKCDFNLATFEDNLFKNCEFIECNFNKSFFYKCEFMNLKIFNSEMKLIKLCECITNKDFREVCNITDSNIKILNQKIKQNNIYFNNYIDCNIIT